MAIGSKVKWPITPDKSLYRPPFISTTKNKILLLREKKCIKVGIQISSCNYTDVPCIAISDISGSES